MTSPRPVTVACELRSLTDPGQSNPVLPADHPFTDVQPSRYWSSSTYAGNTILVWYVEVEDGPVGYEYKRVYPFYV